MCPKQKFCSDNLCIFHEGTYHFTKEPVHPDHNFTHKIPLPRSFPQPRPMTSKITYPMRSSRSHRRMPVRACLEHLLVTTQSVLLQISAHQSASVGIYQKQFQLDLRSWAYVKLQKRQHGGTAVCSVASSFWPLTSEQSKIDDRDLGQY